MTPFGIRKKLKSLLGGGTPAPAPAPVPRFPVTFELPDGSTFVADAKLHDSLVLASGRGASPIATGCSDGTCGTCQCDVIAGADQLSAATDHETQTKAANGIDASRRLGCQTAVQGDGVHVRIINVFGEEPVA